MSDPLLADSDSVRDAKIKEITEQKEIFVMSSAAVYCLTMTTALGFYAFNPNRWNPNAVICLNGTQNLTQYT